MLFLKIHHPDADPYKLDGVLWNLWLAIQSEADCVMSMADSRHLSENSDEARDEFRHRVINNASLALTVAGDRYRDPLGTLWELVEEDDD